MEKQGISVISLAFPQSCGKIYKNYFYICVFVKNRSCEKNKFAVNLNQWKRQKPTEKPTKQKQKHVKNRCNFLV